MSNLNYEYLSNMVRSLRDPHQSLFDPFRINPPSIMGMRVREVPNVPVLQISPDFPYVSDKFRAEWNSWALERFGTRNMVPDGTAYMFSGNIFMNPRSVACIKNIT